MLHITIAKVQTAEWKLFLFVGIDCTSKFAVAQLGEKADRKMALGVQSRHLMDRV